MAGSHGGGFRQESSELAPVIPLFGDRPHGVEVARAGDGAASPETGDGERADDWRSVWDDEVVRAASGERDDIEGHDPAERVPLAEKHLLKRLRVRSLSVAEARNALAAFGLAPEESGAVLAALEARGYLDDTALAEQLVHVGVDRKRNGRRVIAQTLAKRGVPRDVADAALRALPDDDDERALEFARSKARAMRSLDHDVALRRLIGQLARRGYAGSHALAAAKQALEEEGDSGVRFR